MVKVIIIAGRNAIPSCSPLVVLLGDFPGLLEALPVTLGITYLRGRQEENRIGAERPKDTLPLPLY
jgi:hypothetical protein